MSFRKGDSGTLELTHIRGNGAVDSPESLARNLYARAPLG
jgi:hypothetical protein